ncbi:MAG TPA: GC-type dockerin domain-anchored protein [Phycisphaerales bacterium]|nr:GC-type dockerin domain-anchored protein [Phycisphaerales bacterium]
MRLCMCGLALSVAGAGAVADVVTGFEAPEYSIGVLTGQNGWYLPSAGGVDFNVAAYGSDAFGFAVNPTGGEQFLIGQFMANHARAQLDVDYTGSTQWEIAYDVNVIYDGSAAATDNIGSASLQDSTTAATFIPLLMFNAADTGWNHNVIAYDAAGNQVTLTPAPEWMDLEFNSWHRATWVVDFATNRVLSGTLVNLSTGASSTVEFADVYLQGGAAGGRPLPTAFRFFSSGNEANITGWDNLSITPAGAECFADFDGNGVVDTRDVIAFLNAWNADDQASDCDENGVIDTRDVICFLNAWNMGC